MLKFVSITLLLFALGNSLHTVCQSVQTDTIHSDDSADTKSVPTLSYCDLLKSQSRYAGKLVRIKASWQFGFERSFLYTRQCSQQPKAWLEFVDDKDACSQSKDNRNAPSKYDKEADVTVTGKLYGPGHYGHLGAYEYKFVVVCMEKIKVTASDNTDK
jgi:starvation-inducible outer membrane lipoprotein